jgi:hypothetical protein
MASSVEQVEQDIAALTKATIAIANDFHTLYASYLKALGETVRQQLILAGYHVCTQGYPSQFMALSVNQQQELQQALRELAKQVQANILETLSKPGTTEPSLIDLIGNALLGDLLLSNPSISNPLISNPLISSTLMVDGSIGDGSISDGSISDPAIGKALDPGTPSSPSSDSDSMVPSQELPTLPSPPTKPLTPDDVAEWQEILEQSITGELRSASHYANRILQQSGILPKKLPDALLQAAGKSDMAEMAAPSPNLLNVLIEAIDEQENLGQQHLEDDDDALDDDDLDDALDDDLDEDLNDTHDYGNSTAIVHIVAVHLRLAEIEFADPKTTAFRNRLRSLSHKLKLLGRHYRRKRRELAIAQAQSAWRASWTGDR